MTQVSLVPILLMGRGAGDGGHCRLAWTASDYARFRHRPAVALLVGVSPRAFGAVGVCRPRLLPGAIDGWAGSPFLFEVGVAGLGLGRSMPPSRASRRGLRLRSPPPPS